MHLYIEYSQGVFNIKHLIFTIVENILCSHAFSTERGVFSEDFLYKIMLEPEKKSQIAKTLFPETIYFKNFFPT